MENSIEEIISDFNNAEPDIIKSLNKDNPWKKGINLAGNSFFRIIGGERYERVSHEIINNLLTNSKLNSWRFAVIKELFRELCKGSQPKNNKNITVISECVFGDLRVDIYIRTSDGYEMAIELKVGTEFGKKQEDKYIEWLSCDDEHRFFVLVTPDLHDKVTKKIFNEYDNAKLISWYNIVKIILENCPSKKTVLSESSWSEKELDAYIILLEGAMCL